MHPEIANATNWKRNVKFEANKEFMENLSLHFVDHNEILVFAKF